MTDKIEANKRELFTGSLIVASAAALILPGVAVAQEGDGRPRSQLSPVEDTQGRHATNGIRPDRSVVLQGRQDRSSSRHLFRCC